MGVGVKDSSASVFEVLDKNGIGLGNTINVIERAGVRWFILNIEIDGRKCKFHIVIASNLVYFKNNDEI